MKTLISKNPFREGSASSKIYMALARAQKPLSISEIASRAKVSLAQTATLVAAYQNIFHNAPLRRIGVAVVRIDGGFSLKACRAVKTAKRPERGRSKRNQG